MFEKIKNNVKDLFSIGPVLPKSFKKEDREEFLKDSNQRSSVAMKKAVITAAVMVAGALYIHKASGKEINPDIYFIMLVCGIWVAFAHYRTFK